MKNIIRLIIFILTFGLSLFGVWMSSSNIIDDTSTENIKRSVVWRKILLYEDKDLKSLNNEQSIKLFNDFYKLVDKNLYVGFGKSILFTKFVNEKNQIRYILIGGDKNFESENYSRLSFQIFDKDGIHLSSREIINLSYPFEKIKVIKSPESGTTILKFINMPFYPNNYKYEKHNEEKFYAVIGDDIQLVETRKIIE